MVVRAAGDSNVIWASRRWDLEILAYLPHKKFLDLAMTWDGGDFTGVSLEINGMVGAFSKKSAAVCF